MKLGKGVIIMTVEIKKIHLMKIYTGEDVIVGDEPLYRTILNEARRLNLAGATVVKGIEGYATEVRGIERRALGLLTGVSNLPVIITIVDTPENLKKMYPLLNKKAVHALVILEESNCLMTEYIKERWEKLGREF